MKVSHLRIIEGKIYDEQGRILKMLPEHVSTIVWLDEPYQQEPRRASFE